MVKWCYLNHGTLRDGNGENYPRYLVVPRKRHVVMCAIRSRIPCRYARRDFEDAPPIVSYLLFFFPDVRIHLHVRWGPGAGEVECRSGRELSRVKREIECRHVRMYVVKRASVPGSVTGRHPFIDVERSSARAAMELDEDEDLNKCRDLLASDDGCDPARGGKLTPEASKKSEARGRRTDGEKGRERGKKERKSNYKSRTYDKEGIRTRRYAATKDR